MRRNLAFALALFSLLSCLPSKPSDQGSKHCSSDDDCVIQCIHHSNCCGALCQCDDAYNKTYSEQIGDYCRALQKMEAHGAGGEHACPVAKCPQEDFTYVAKCEKNQCKAIKTAKK